MPDNKGNQPPSKTNMPNEEQKNIVSEDNIDNTDSKMLPNQSVNMIYNLQEYKDDIKYKTYNPAAQKGSLYIRPPEVNMGMSMKPMLDPIEFVYSYDFDENGLLYYLGTYGKTKDWVNPLVTGQISVFYSSLCQGTIEDISGRFPANCRT